MISRIPLDSTETVYTSVTRRLWPTTNSESKFQVSIDARSVVRTRRMMWSKPFVSDIALRKQLPSRIQRKEPRLTDKPEAVASIAKEEAKQASNWKKKKEWMSPLTSLLIPFSFFLSFLSPIPPSYATPFVVLRTMRISILSLSRFFFSDPSSD